MLGEVLIGLSRFAVMNGSVIIVMMACAIQMFHLMGDVESFDRQPSCLHGKAMQRNEHQQKNAKETAHGKPIEQMNAELYQLHFIRHDGSNLVTFVTSESKQQ